MSCTSCVLRMLPEVLRLCVGCEEALETAVCGLLDAGEGPAGEGLVDLGAMVGEVGEVGVVGLNEEVGVVFYEGGVLNGKKIWLGGGMEEGLDSFRGAECVRLGDDELGGAREGQLRMSRTNIYSVFSQIERNCQRILNRQSRDHSQDVVRANGTRKCCKSLPRSLRRWKHQADSLSSLLGTYLRHLQPQPSISNSL